MVIISSPVPATTKSGSISKNNPSSIYTPFSISTLFCVTTLFLCHYTFLKFHTLAKVLIAYQATTFAKVNYSINHHPSHHSHCSHCSHLCPCGSHPPPFSPFPPLLPLPSLPVRLAPPSILTLFPRFFSLIIFAKKMLKNICSLQNLCVHLQRFSEELLPCLKLKKHKLVNYRILNKKFKTL